jgi:hypothetical protein
MNRRIYASASHESIPAVLRYRQSQQVAAFMKELMRRAAQFYLQDDGRGPLPSQSVDGLWEEMLFARWSLNA